MHEGVTVAMDGSSNKPVPSPPSPLHGDYGITMDQCGLNMDYVHTDHVQKRSDMMFYSCSIHDQILHILTRISAF